MTLPSGASLAHGELKRIEDALAELAKSPGDPSKDHHAPREISVRINLHVHHEYPRLMYKGKKMLSVNSDSEKEQAISDGYSVDAPIPVQEEEE